MPALHRGDALTLQAKQLGVVEQFARLLDEPASQAYAHAFQEVKAVGSADSPARPQDRSDVARFFAAASAAHAWNIALQQVAIVDKRSLTFKARVFALLNMAISDGLVASMETKYHYLFWRPVTAIRLADIDGNDATEVDAGWTPFISTPSFPSYPSAHASASYAARAVAERFFSAGQHHTFLLTHPAVPGVTLAYRSFRDLTEDIDDARVYGGIHFRFDQVAGARQGYRGVRGSTHTGFGRAFRADATCLTRSAMPYRPCDDGRDCGIL